MLDWKGQFSDVILKRGKSYFDGGAVKSLGSNSLGFEARVKGSELYRVEIDVCNDEIMNMFCSCPHARQGFHCKHMAAVLYAIEDGMSTEDYATLIDSLSKEQLAKFARMAVRKDLSLIDVLHDFVHEGSVSFDFVRDIQRIVDCFGGSIDFRNVSSFVYELSEYMKGHVRSFLKEHFVVEAFELSIYVFSVLKDLDLDNSDGYISMLCLDCFQVWKELFGLSNDFEKNYMFGKFLSMRFDDDFLEFFPELIDEFLLFVYEDQNLLKAKLDEVDHDIEACHGKFHNVYRMAFDSLHIVLFRLELMERLGFSEEDLLEFRLKFRFVPEVRRLEIEECVKKGCLKDAIGLLNGAKDEFREDPIWFKNFSEDLICLYEILGCDREYKEALISYVNSIFLVNLDFVHRLKRVCSEKEWLKLVDVILENIQYDYLKCQFLCEEKLYDRLMDLLESLNDIRLVELYEQVLKYKFSDRLIPLYKKHLDDKVQVVQDCKKYCQMIKYLQKISSLKNGGFF